MNEVERDPVEVMFIRTADDPAEFGPAFRRLEELVGTRGRKEVSRLSCTSESGPPSRRC